MTNEKPIALKTAVNQRVPLQERCRPIQSLSGTYGTGAICDGSSTNASMMYGSSSAPASADVVTLPRRHVGHTTYSAATTNHIKSAQDIPPRVGPGGTISGASLPGGENSTGPQCSVRVISPDAPPLFTSSLYQFDAATTHQATIGAGIAHDDKTHFYSNVRKLEKVDDDQRVALKGSQRTMDVMRKREAHPDCQPPQQITDFNVQRSNVKYSNDNGVECTHLSKKPTHRQEYVNTHGRIPDDLPYERHPHARAVTVASTGIDLCQGCAKSRGDVAPKYLGHTPGAMENFAKINGANDLLRQHTKCFVNVVSGHEPRPTGQERIRASDVTVQGKMLAQAVRAPQDERTINRRVTK